MKKIILFSVTIILSLVILACTKKEEANNNTTAPTTETTSNNNSTTPTTTTNAPTLKPGEIPFAGFPTVSTTAKAGEYVLCPSYNWIQDMVTKGPEKTTFIFYSQKMVAPGDVESEIEFMTGKQKVPNPYIIPIPAGQSAKAGDILLTWWQSGSGMQRAIVVDAANPKEPVVRYLDLDYDNPATSRDGKTTIGKMDEKLKPDTFVKINAPMDTGSAIAAKAGSDYKSVRVVRVAGDKVLTIGFAGTVKVYNKSDCVAVPLVPTVKTGDKVKAVFAGTYKDAEVIKVDPKIGRVWVKFDFIKDKEYVLPFGEVTPKL